ncbi:hypothetical protein NPX13_g1188 [Xylaria arbuscula]|uniref:Uncharacterized protein n=1 Tax=Xylaria arbuscula TaxID=114810 RepID=A0A9W8TRI3_9PEZI|nr:hypothetical protein NPX13_g1188 [Xylaria arbuscula]
MGDASNSQHHAASLTKGAIAGIAVGATVGALLLIGGLGYYLIWRRRRNGLRISSGRDGPSYDYDAIKHEENPLDPPVPYDSTPQLMSAPVLEMEAVQKPVEVAGTRTTRTTTVKKSPVVTEMEGDHERPVAEMEAADQEKKKDTNESRIETFELP